MAVPIKLVLLICIIEVVRAQFPEGDSSVPQRPRPPGRFLPRPATRASSALVQQPLISQRIRRPISLKSKPTTDANEFSPFTAVRPKPNFLHASKPENPSTPPPQLIQQDEPTKPVNEETKEEVDNGNRQPSIKIVPVNPQSYQHPSNLVPNSPFTPKPESVIQIRPSPTSSFNRQSPLQEENIAPVQYRPPKPIKFRKPVEELPEIRNPVTNQQSQFPSQQPQFLQLQQARHHEDHQQQQQQHHHHQQQQQHQHQHQQQQQQPQQQQHYPQQHHKQQPQQQQSLIRQSPKKATSYREKKPVAQIIRRWREDNDDGSITWGFENDDGSYKEEIIGIDCVTRGKYGYVDPDGIRREYTYETGIKCDEEEQQDEQDGFVDYQENKLVLPNGKTIDLSSMGKKQARRPQPIYRN